MATTNKYYKNDEEFGLLQRDVDTKVSFTLPNDPLNDDDTQQRISYVCTKYPELNKLYFVTRGETVEIPKYVYDRAIKNSYLFAGHAKVKDKTANLR